MKYLATIGAITVAVMLIVAALLVSTDRLVQDASRMLPKDKSQPMTYIALGDSTVYGVGASSPEHNYVSQLAGRLRAVYPRAQLSNLGVSGATSADVVARQLARAVDARPDLITLSIGPNDITQGKDVQQYERNLEAIFHALAQKTSAVVVVNLIPDLAVAPRFSPELKTVMSQQTMRFNEALARVAWRYDVEVVDLYTPSQQETPQHPEWVSADDYHPSDSGYARWAELMWDGVSARIK